MLERLADDGARVDRLCELNVIEQVDARRAHDHRAGRVAARPGAHAARLDLQLRDGLLRDLGLEAGSPQALESRLRARRSRALPEAGAG